MQVPSLKGTYKSYHDYSKVDYDQLLSDLKIEPTHEVHFVQSAVLAIKGSEITITALPTEAQVAPVYAMKYIQELLELHLVGNTTQNREFWGSNTSSDGSVYSLRNDEWVYNQKKSVSFIAEGDGRHLFLFNHKLLVGYRGGRLEEISLTDEMVQ